MYYDRLHNEIRVGDSVRCFMYTTAGGGELGTIISISPSETKKQSNGVYSKSHTKFHVKFIKDDEITYDIFEMHSLTVLTTEDKLELLGL